MVNIYQIITCVFCLFIFLEKGIGQEPGMWHLTDQEGLPSMTVYQTAQDNQGYVWMGTERGIYRFDGKAFKRYNSPDLNDNEILTVKVDQLGRVWFRNLAGQFFYIRNEVVYNVTELQNANDIAVQDFAIYGNIICLTLKYKDGVSFAYFSYNETGENSSIVYDDRRYSYLSSFVFADNEVYIISTKTGGSNFVLLRFENEQEGLKESKVFAIDEFHGLKSFYKNDDQWFLLLNKKSSLEIRSFKDGQSTPFLKFKETNSISNFKVIDNTFWFQTPRGVFLQALDQPVLNAENYLLKDISTNHLMVDAEGNKWISTTGQGIYIINAPQTQVFKTNNFDLPSNKIYSLAFDPFKKKLLVGHDNGLLSIINQEGKTQKISVNSSGRFVNLLIDDMGDYWCANDRGLFKIDTNLEVEEKLAFAIKSLFQDSNNDLWISTYRDVFNIQNEKLADLNTINRSVLMNKIVIGKSYSLLEDFFGNIWIGTIKGIQLYKNKTVVPFLEDGNHNPYNVSSMSQTPDSIIWVGTRGDGLLGIKNQKVVSRYNQTDGLASNTIKSIVYSDATLWIGTDNGLNKFDLETKSWEWINTADGLPSNEINAIEVLDQEVWVGTTKGLVSFSVNADFTNTYPPPIYISSIKIEERDTTIQDSFFLPYHQNSLQIDFTGIGFRGKGDGVFEYKLSEVDDDWVRSESSFTRYPNLSPGTYTFEVYALNEDRVRSEKPQKIFFSISPPFWETWWARLLALVTFSGLILLIVNTRIKRQKRDQFFIDQVAELKANALRSQMNPHFIFNSLNAIQQFMTTNNREQAMIYLSRFGKLIRMIFEQSQREKITLEEELEFLKLYLNLEQLRFMDRVEIEMNMDEDLEAISDEVFVPPLLIQPIIENSFKHGFMYKEELGILRINFSQKNNYLLCTIEDNGIGRKKAAELGQKELKDRTSSGLTTARERLKINNKSIENGVGGSGIKITDLHEEVGDVRGTLVEVTIFCKELK